MFDRHGMNQCGVNANSTGRRGIAISGCALAIAAWATAGPAFAVDDAQLQAASNESREWLTYGHNYENQRFSTLDQINRTNVRQLVPKWIYQTGITASFQASPVVADGIMYVSTPRNDVVALDAVTGVEKWRYHHQMKTDKLCCGPANRGAAVAAWYGPARRGLSECGEW